ncbi:MAG TPA: DUF3343 domain-containing protein [Petrotogaceae bacterium]|mgnify:FL=1|jgi:hypothetical protein|nr:DUF3343 domain-containing protein [Petrotogaceae bacterium]
MLTTKDLNCIIRPEGTEPFEVFQILKRAGVFVKIFPAPKSIFMICAPVILISESSLEQVKILLKSQGINYESFTLKNDIIQELL